MFGGLIKSIGNAITAPIKSAGSLLTGKGNLGDLLSVGSMFAPGGNIGSIFGGQGLGALTTKNLLSNYGTSGLLGQLGISKDLFNGKAQPLDILNAFGTLQGLGAGSGRMPPVMNGYGNSGNANPQFQVAQSALMAHLNGTKKLTQEEIAQYMAIMQQSGGGGLAGYDPKNPMNNLNSITNAQYDNLASNIQFNNEMTPIRQSIIRSGVNQLDPSNLMTIARTNMNQAGRQSDRLRLSENAAMRASGVSDSIIQGRNQDMQGRQIESNNEIQSQVFSPENIQRAMSTQLSLLDDDDLDQQAGQVASMLQAMQGANLNERAYNDSQPNNNDLISGLLGQFLGNGGDKVINNLFNPKRSGQTAAATSGGGRLPTGTGRYNPATGKIEWT
jgi:hypothetical protein